MPSTAKPFPKLAGCPSSDKHTPGTLEENGANVQGEADASVKEAQCHDTVNSGALGGHTPDTESLLESQADESLSIHSKGCKETEICRPKVPQATCHVLAQDKCTAPPKRSSSMSP